VWRGRGERGEGEGSTSWVQGIDIDTEVDRFLSADSVADLLDYTRHADLVNLPRLHDLEPAVAVIIVIAEPAQSRADPRVDVGVVGQQAFAVCVVEIGPVVYGGLLAGGPAEDFRPPGV